VLRVTSEVNTVQAEVQMTSTYPQPEQVNQHLISLSNNGFLEGIS
jgi:hypothetical protein